MFVEDYCRFSRKSYRHFILFELKESIYCIFIFDEITHKLQDVMILFISWTISEQARPDQVSIYVYVLKSKGVTFVSSIVKGNNARWLTPYTRGVSLVAHKTIVEKGKMIVFCIFVINFRRPSMTHCLHHLGKGKVRWMSEWTIVAAAPHRDQLRQHPHRQMEQLPVHREAAGRHSRTALRHWGR